MNYSVRLREAIKSDRRATKSSSFSAPWSPCLRLRTATRPFCCFAVAHHQHVGNLLHLRVADFEVHLFAAVVHPRANAGRFQAACEYLCAYSACRSVMGSTMACTGASHTGNAPA